MGQRNLQRRRWILGSLTLISPILVILAQDRQPATESCANAPFKVLLIGNRMYQHLPRVETAINDVHAIESALLEIGIKSVPLTDLTDNAEQKKQIDTFTSAVRPEDVVLFYYTGHGIQSEDDDFLLPLDYDPGDPEDIQSRGYAVSARLVARLKKASARILILDASRPWTGPRGTMGLQELPSTNDRTALLFSTSPNHTSPPQGQEMPTSVFAQQFIATLKTPGLTIPELFERIRNLVGAASGSGQQPYGSFSGGLASCRVRNPLPPGPETNVPRTNTRDKQDYLWIPEGQFMMGCVPNDRQCKPDEKLPHPVRLSHGFWMGKTEVTVTAYLDRYARQNKVRTPAAPPQNPGWKNGQEPMVNVTWQDGANFCKWAGGRLPTEAEWEYAAKAKTTTKYPWGDEITKDLARYNHTLKTEDNNKTPWQELAPVGQYEPNAWGLLDVVGNVWEWCYDWFQDHYDPGAANDPKGPSTGTRRVLRGGSFYSSAAEVRLSSRQGLKPEGHYNQDGFRCVIDKWPN